MYFEYRIVKIEKGLFFIEYKTAPYGVWHEVDKKFKTKPKAEISAYLLAIVGKIIFDAATADYKLYKHVRLCRKRLLRQRYEDYAWLLFQLEKDTEVFNLTHNTRDWTFEDWREFYLKKAKEDKQ